MDQALPPELASVNAWVAKLPQNGDLLRQQKTEIAGMMKGAGRGGCPGQGPSIV
jgi:hypothetical protein